MASFDRAPGHPPAPKPESETHKGVCILKEVKESLSRIFVLLGRVSCNMMARLHLILCNRF